jgi:tryptophan synthase alpha chain
VSIDGIFERCRSLDRAALIPYLMAGDPSLPQTESLLAAACEGGADIIEVGVPYSDPIADGPTISAAATRALRGGTTLDRIIAAAKRIDRSRITAPLVAFTYFNPIFVRGVERTAVDLRQAGFEAVIVADLPPEEAAPARDALLRAGLGLIMLIAPTTPAQRVPRIVELSSHFVYLVSRMGVTGAGEAPWESIESLASRVRETTAKPIAVGFGISTPDHVRRIGAVADGVVVGSALVDRIAAREGRDAATAVRDYCRLLAGSLGRRRGPRRTRSHQ